MRTSIFWTAGINSLSFHNEINCRELAKDFVVAGTASESLYGACESMFKPDMVSFYTAIF